MTRTRWPLVVASVALVASSTGCGGATTATRATSTSATSALFATSPSDFDALVRSERRLPTVVNAWASWCIPCRSEAPLFAKAARSYEGRVRFIGLDVQDVRKDALDFIKQFDLPYPSGFDGRGEVMRHLRILGLPTTLFYRPDGSLAFVRSGEIHRDELERKLSELVRASRAA